MICPVIGNNDSEMKEINAFYKFWTNFESWRCFDHFAKHSLEALKQANDRYQKRKMEKENKDEVKSHASNEHKRMIELVETARKLDPRLIRAEKAALEAKNASKNAIADKKKAEKAAQMALLNASKNEEAAKKAAEKAADDAARELIKQEGRLLAGEFKVLIGLCDDKMPGSKAYDKYWVNGTCKTKVRKAIYAQMIVK